MAAALRSLPAIVFPVAFDSVYYARIGRNHSKSKEFHRALG